ncbi:MAG: hypothetical protein ACFFD9_02765 [Candidatus Thorarchaeota archaeon]
MNVKRSSKTIAKALEAQYAGSWKMLQAAIADVPDDKWHAGLGKWFYSYTAYHIIETVQLYMSSDPDAMKWGARAGFEWSPDTNVEKDVLPRITKDLVNSYMLEIRQQLSEVVNSMDDNEYSDTDAFHWFGSIIDKLVYCLRHTAHHIGELCRALREWGFEPVKWS